ncbi:hypothetical protein ACFQO4_06030 [Saliphagus sp. GCM10025334]
MIRVVLAALLAVALLAMAVPALEHAAAENTDRHARTALADLTEAASSLAREEEVPPPGHPPPQRTITIALPPDAATAHPLSAFEIERLDRDSSVARYRFEDRAMRTRVIDVPIVADATGSNRPVKLQGTGERTLRLTLETDDCGQPVVVATRV